MRLDAVVRDQGRTLDAILRALTNNLTARDNFGPEGEAGQVLMSNGPDSIPSYQDLPASPSGASEKTTDASELVSGILPEARLQGPYRGITSVDSAAVVEWEAALTIDWSQLISIPTTIAGYGITDAYTKTEVDALLAALVLDDLADVVITAPASPEVLKYDGANWVNAAVDFSELTGKPTTVAGYGITDAYTKTEVDTLLAGKADTATTLAGYGITDAYTKTAVDALLAALTTHDLADWPADAAGVLTNDGAGNYSWAAGGGGVSSVFGRTGAVIAVAGDYNASLITAGTFPTGTFKFSDELWQTAASAALAALTREKIHFEPASITNDDVLGLSWYAAGATHNQTYAKLVVQSSSGYGTKMLFRTTDSYASGDKDSMILDHKGSLYLNRAGLQVGPQAVFPSTGFYVTLGTFSASRAELRAQDFGAGVLKIMQIIGSAINLQTDGSINWINTSGTTLFTIDTDATVGLYLQTQFAGSGYSLAFRNTAGTTKQALDETNNRWQFNCPIMWSPDNTYDIGVSTTVGRPRTVYAATSVVVGATPSGFVDVGQEYRTQGTKVLSTRRSGWTAPTGTATRTSFNTGTVTLSQLAERVKALIDDFIAHGAIGA